MPTIQSLREKRKKTAVADMMSAFVTGYTGQFNADGSMTASDEVGTLYVRIGATTPTDKRPATRVNNAVVDTAVNLPVILWKLNGEWDVFALNTQRARRQLGAAIGNAATPRRAGDRVQETVDGRRVKEGRIRVWTAGTLELNAESFNYVDTAGDLKLWTPTTANALDLLSHVPAAVGGANQGRWVRLALDPDATTPALEAFDGAGMSALLYPPDGWLDIAVPDGYTPLDSVWLQTGDTTILDDARYAFGRLLLNALNAGSGGLEALNVNLTEVGNVGVGEDDLLTYSVPASSLATNGDRLNYEFALSIASTVNAKRIRVYLDNTLLFDTGALPISVAASILIGGTILRESQSVQKTSARMNTSSATLPAYANVVGCAEDLATALVLKVTGEATSNNDIVAESMTADLIHAP